MSDHFFPISIPSEEELRLILLVRYVLSSEITKQGFVSVKAWNFELNIASELGIILVPVHYKDHLCRFLWREMVFMEVIRRYALRQVNLVAPAAAMAKRYIMYMDGMAEGLLTTARRRQDDPHYRSVLFEMYLCVEYFVGRHEYDVAGKWRQDHPETILECQDALKLDWNAKYHQYDEEDPMWSGAKYKFKLMNVPYADWQGLADRVAQYLGIANTAPAKPRKGKKGGTKRGTRRG